MTDSTDSPVDPQNPNQISISGAEEIPPEVLKAAAKKQSKRAPEKAKSAESRPASRPLPTKRLVKKKNPPAQKVSSPAPPKTKPARPQLGQSQSRPLVITENYRPPVDSTDLDPVSTEPEQNSESESVHIWQSKKTRRNSSGFIASLAFHLLIFIALALWFFAPREKSKGVLSIQSEPNDTPQIEKSPFDDIQVDIQTDPNENKVDVDVKDINNDLANEEIANEKSEKNEKSSKEPWKFQTMPMEISNVGMTRPNGGGLEGRTQSNRSSKVGTGGPTEASELAVEEGLRWLSLHQYENGAWKFNHRKAPQCDGRCRTPGSHGSTTGATGLAIMAFIGAGYTHQEGPYQKQVGRALEYLVSRIRESRYGGDLSEGTMYAHAIATIALCESYAMTKDQKLLGPAKLSVQYIISAQSKGGGWRYVPGQTGDITVTTWQIQALKSAEMAGIEVPKETWTKTRAFLDSMQNPSGFFGYEKPEDGNSTCTAIGMLARMYTGWHREHDMFAPGHSLVKKSGVSKSNLYHNYYATQALFHYNHPKSWPEWNQQMRDYLVETQDQKGHQKGSWYFRNKYGDEGGRHFNTCMAIMILEVYYRYMPLYDAEKFQLEK